MGYVDIFSLFGGTCTGTCDTSQNFSMLSSGYFHGFVMQNFLDIPFLAVFKLAMLDMAFQRGNFGIFL